MKKFYALLAMVMMVVGTMAAMPTEPVKASPATVDARIKAAALRNQMKLQAGNFEDVFDTRSYTDPSTGVTWTLSFVNDKTMSWIEMLWGDPDYYTFEEVPYYCVLCYLSNDDTQPTSLSMALFWPALGAVKNLSPSEFTEEDLTIAQIDYLVGLEDSTFQICSMASNGGWYPADVFATPGDSTSGRIAWGIYPSFPDIASYKGKSWGMQFSNLSNTTRASKFSIDDYNPESMECYATFNLYLAEVNSSTGEFVSGGSTATFRTTYKNGTIWTSGFENRNFTLPIKEIHVFNADETSSDDNWDYANRDGDDWGPVQQYYIVTVGPNMVLNYNNFNLSGKFDVTKVGVAYENSYDDLSFLMGMAYGKAGNETPAPSDYFVLQPMDYEYVYNSSGVATGMEAYNVPEQGTMLPWYNISGYKDEGFMIAYEGHSFNPYSETLDIKSDLPKTYILMTSPEGFQVHIADQLGDTLDGTFKGDIILHPKYNDVSVTSTLAAVSTENTGVEDIFDTNDFTVNGNTIVAPAGAQVYDLNGRRVNASNLAKGVYVVRSANKVAKVLVK